jgi:hypothetical protein
VTPPVIAPGPFKEILHHDNASHTCADPGQVRAGCTGGGVGPEGGVSGGQVGGQVPSGPGEVRLYNKESKWLAVQKVETVMDRPRTRQPRRGEV